VNEERKTGKNIKTAKDKEVNGQGVKGEREFTAPCGACYGQKSIFNNISIVPMAAKQYAARRQPFWSFLVISNNHN